MSWTSKLLWTGLESYRELTLSYSEHELDEEGMGWIL